MADSIQITGLKEFRSGLKAMHKDLPKALRVAFNDAADVVVMDARPKIPSRSGRAKGSVKARSTQTSSRVVGGGNKAPHYPWLDFGGRVGRRNSVKRPFLKEGRYIYNAYFRNKRSGRYQEILSDGLIKVGRDAGIEVTAT